MLSLSPIRGGASGASNYYLAEEKKLHIPHNQFTISASGNYYLAESKTNENTTQWFGKIAEKEGILGKPIDETKLERVLSGYLDKEQVKGAGKTQRRTGNDLTFSAPKGASILGLVYGDTRILDAHDRAVKTVLSQIEKDVAQYRKIDPSDRSTSYHNSEQLLFGIVKHKTNRENEAQIHSHALMANMTYDDEGKLKNLATCKIQNEFERHGSMERIFKNQKYYTAIYHSEMARDYEKMGYAIKSLGNGQVDIDGVPDEVIAANSTRRQQILDHVDSLGVDSGKAKDIAAQATRKAKTYTPEHTLLDEWKAKNKTLDFDGLAFVAAARAGKLRVPQLERQPSESANIAIEKSLSHLSAKSSQFTYEAILTEAAHSFTYGTTHYMSDLKQTLDLKIKEGLLIPLNDNDRNNGLFTTTALIDKEKKLIESTQGRATRAKILPEPESIAQLALSKEHEKTITALMASKKAINVCHVAGSSQSISSALLHVGSQSGRQVIFVTPNNLVKQQNQQQVKAQSFTVLQWVKNQFRKDQVENVHAFLNQPALSAKKGKHHLIVVEHANKLSLDQTQALIERTKAQGSKIIFLNQSQSKLGFSSGNAMETLQKGYVDIQTWRSEKTNSTELFLQEEADKDTRKSIIAEKFAALTPKQRQQTAIVASSHRDAALLNTRVRGALDKTGALSEQRIQIETYNPIFLSEEQRTVAKNYSVGMRLTEFVKGNKPQHFTVERVNKGNNTLMIRTPQGYTSSLKMDASNVVNRRFSISQPDLLEVAAGDRLKFNANVFKTDLKQHDHVTVEKMTKHAMTLVGDDGSKHIVAPSLLHHAAISYGYASSLSQANPKQPNLWVDMPSYLASKETMNDILSYGPNQLHILTENTLALEEHIGKSKIQPSTMAIVMANDKGIEKYINAQTQKVLFNDVATAINNIFDKNAEKPLIEQAVTFAINHVSEQQAGFTHAELVTHALRYSFEVLGTSITKDEIQIQLDAMKDSGTVLSAEYSDGTRWTTKDALETESRILKRMEEGQNKVEPYVTEQQAKAYLSRNTWLSEGQKEGITLIATSSDQYVGIQGFAGVGKSTMLEQGIELIQEVQAMTLNAPINVIGLAPTHAAVNELQEKGVVSQTSQSLLRDFTHGAVEPSHYRNTLFLLDESSMVSNKQLDDFTDLIEKSGAKVALLGDMYQLQSKEAGKPFELAFKRKALKSVVMKDIKRQDSDSLLAAVHQVINKNPLSTLESLKKQPEFEQNQYQEIPKHAYHNVISTYVDTGSPFHDSEVAKGALYLSAVEEYLSRTPESRQNTMMIAYSHKERDLMTSLIRKGLQKTNELGEQNVQLKRLRGIGASKEDLKTLLPYKSGTIVCTGRDEYLKVYHVDRQHEIVHVVDMHTGESKTLIPKHHDHKMTTLWHLDEMPVSIGEQITWRKTDKALDLEGNKPLTVENINLSDATITVKNESGKTTTLDLTKMQSSHWDYRYTRTADMAQGATTKNIITVISASANLTNIRRGYIDITRASDNVKLFTDNQAKLIDSWLNHHDNNASAIETIEKTRPIHEQYFKSASYHIHENPKYQHNGEFSYTLYGKDINEQLRPYTESVARLLLGQPNASKSDVDYLAFGQGNSHLKVSLTGEYRGFYRDWTTGEKGNLINLIMNHKGLSYKQAVTEAANYLSDPKSLNLEKNERHDVLIETLPKQVSKLKSWAHQYWEQGQPIEGTLGDKYLSNAISDNIQSLENIRFHPKVYSSESQQTHPAIIARLSDNKDELQAIEISYLNENGEKAGLKIDTRLLGNKSGNSVKIHEGTNTEVSAIAVGIESSVALKNNNPHDVDIISINNINDARTVNTKYLRENIVLITNGEDKESISLLNDITKRLENEGHTVKIISQNHAENSDVIKTIINSNDTIDSIINIKHQNDDLINKLAADINSSDTHLSHNTNGDKHVREKRIIDSIQEDKDLSTELAIRELEISKTSSQIEQTHQSNQRTIGELTR